MVLKEQFTGKEVIVDDVKGIRDCVRNTIVRCVCDFDTRVEFKLSEDRCNYVAYFYVFGNDTLAVHTKVNVYKDIGDVLEEYANAINNGHSIYDIQIRTVLTIERAIKDAHKLNQETYGVYYNHSYLPLV